MDDREFSVWRVTNKKALGKNHPYSRRRYFSYFRPDQWFRYVARRMYSYREKERGRSVVKSGYMSNHYSGFLDRYRTKLKLAVKHVPSGSWAWFSKKRGQKKWKFERAEVVGRDYQGKLFSKKRKKKYYNDK